LHPQRAMEMWLTILEVVMPRYLSVESELVLINCYQCGIGFAFVNTETIGDSTYTECSTPPVLATRIGWHH
jgi:hypothetical protein